MRTDENGDPCPETLGEYRDMCEAIGTMMGVPSNRAVQFLDGKIAESNRDDVVIQADSQMRMLLMPMLTQPAE